VGNLKMKAQALIRLNFLSERDVEIELQSLQPETKTAPAARFSVQVRGEGRNLILSFEAKDTSALRAAINSYLRWVHLTKNVVGLLIALDKVLEG
jgi:tRNA threonylcarbamoyladenosine modification (KEOPS) complex  Pcc1 subunit